MDYNILVVMPVTEEHKATLEAAAPEATFTYVPSKEVDMETVQTANIIIGNVKPAMIKDSKNLKLMQLNSAGSYGFTNPGVMPEQATLCNATGSYGLAISEHMLGMVLCLMKNLSKYRMEQEKHVWSDFGPVNSIYGSKTLVVGFGDIGSEFAVRMNALGSKVTGIRRNKAEKPEYLEGLYQMDKFFDCLEDADIVACCLPGTAATHKLFNEEAFSHMKDGAMFINIGRGNSVDQNALFDALSSGKLSGAGLDVTDPEPLPADDKLWTAPNLLITPHVSGGFHLKETHNRIIGIAARNIRHCVAGEPFENEVDMETGYRKFVE